MDAAKPPRYAIYTRISRDPDGTSTAPARQEKDCRALAEERGYEVVGVYSDADISAYSGARRPGYEELLEAMALGQLDGVLVWKLDRLMRRVVELARFWRIASVHGVALVTKHDMVDTTTPIGVGIMFLIAGLAEQESANTSLRIRAQESEAAEAGRHKGAGRRAYGMKPGWTEVEPDEAKVIREVATRLLSHESIRSVTRDLNDRGIPAAGGGKWTTTGLKSLMRSPRLWGWREHHGVVTAKGEWPAILSEEDGRALHEMLAYTGEPGAHPYHLLTGVLRCGRCGTRMRVGGKDTKGRLRYVCPPAPDGCNAIAIRKEPTDEQVERLLKYRLTSPELAAELAARTGRKRESVDEAEVLAGLAAIERERAENSTDRADGAISRETYVSLMRALDERAERLSRQLVASRRDGPLAVLTQPGMSTAERYDALSLDRRRSVVAAIIDHIDVLATDDPRYLDRLAETLKEEAEEYRAEATGLRLVAKGDVTPAERDRLRLRAEKLDADARRRMRQVKDRKSNANVREPRVLERLVVAWRI